MSLDISKVLAGWDYEPESVSVRILEGDDARKKIQLRLDLGLLQMEIDGRPDGTRVGEFGSWLEFYEHKKREDERSNESTFKLESSDCELLLREGMQFYHRYLSFWHLKMHELCARDTARNLRLFAFVRQNATNMRDKLQFDQWRPYVTLMFTRSTATVLLAGGETEKAIDTIDSGIEAIIQFLTDYGQLRRAETMGELIFLKRWRSELVGDDKPAFEAPMPTSPQDQLREELHIAISEERYEDAARIRDEMSRETS